jgi:hypothetical protein
MQRKKLERKEEIRKKAGKMKERMDKKRRK